MKESAKTHRMVLALACSLLARNAVLRLFIKSIVFCATNPSETSLCCSLEISSLSDVAPFLLALFCAKFKELSSGGVARFCVECAEFKELSRIAAKFSPAPLSAGAAEFAEPPFSCASFLAALLICARASEAAIFFCASTAASETISPTDLWFDLRAELALGFPCPPCASLSSEPARLCSLDVSSLCVKSEFGAPEIGGFLSAIFGFSPLNSIKVVAKFELGFATKPSPRLMGLSSSILKLKNP